MASHKERANSTESQLVQLREENRQLQKDIQSLRERVAAIDGKSGPPATNE
jgi:predicted  nucleic acid-binding Zn-ribbon protein